MVPAETETMSTEEAPPSPPGPARFSCPRPPPPPPPSMETLTNVTPVGQSQLPDVVNNTVALKPTKAAAGGAGNHGTLANPVGFDLPFASL